MKPAVTTLLPLVSLCNEPTVIITTNFTTEAQNKVCDMRFRIGSENV